MRRANSSSKSTLLVLIALGVCVPMGAAVAAPLTGPVATPVAPIRVLNPADAKLVNLSAQTQVFYGGENLRFTALRARPGMCEQVKLTIDGKSRVERSPRFPYTFDISPRDPLYPSKAGKYDVVVEGLDAHCTGKLTYTFAYNPSMKGEVTDVQVTGFKTPDATGQVTILGHGMCSLRIAMYVAPWDKAKSSPLEIQHYQAPIRLPFTAPIKSTASNSGGEHVMEIILLGLKGDGTVDDVTRKAYPNFEGCVVTGPNALGAGLRKNFATFPLGTPPANKPPTASTGGAPAGGGAPLPDQPKPATGKIATLQVPGGSFAEDDPQKLEVKGTGGCGMDLSIKRVDATGGFDKKWPVPPVALDRSPNLYNGTHFDTLAEGSYSAKVVGTNGCTGEATIDFKVTPKNSIKLVKGEPTLSVEKNPISGSAFKRTKDSNINFVVKVPQSIKDEPYAGCCDIQYEFINEYGGWEVYPNSPIQDSSFGLATSQTNAVVFKSVSGFKEGAKWRMKVRAYKFKTEFQWSNWLEFQVDQN